MDSRHLHRPQAKKMEYHLTGGSSLTIVPRISWVSLSPLAYDHYSPSFPGNHHLQDHYPTSYQRFCLLKGDFTASLWQKAIFYRTHQACSLDGSLTLTVGRPPWINNFPRFFYATIRFSRPPKFFGRPLKTAGGWATFNPFVYGSIDFLTRIVRLGMSN